MLLSYKQEPNPADAASSMLSLRTILVVVAVGVLSWGDGNLASTDKDEFESGHRHRACVTVTSSRSSRCSVTTCCLIRSPALTTY